MLPDLGYITTMSITSRLDVVQVGGDDDTLELAQSKMLIDLAESTYIAALALGTDWIPLVLSVLEPYQILE